MKKAVFHMHSTYSHDGKLTIPQLREIGLLKGWDFMFLSDHYEDLTEESYLELVEECQKNSDEQLQIIPGYEKNWGHDICAFGAFGWDEIDDLQTWVNFQKENNAFLCVMHPVKYKFVIPDKILKVVDAFEIWNTKWPYDGRFFPNPQSLSLLNNGRVGLAGQDIHKKTDVTGVVNMVDTDSLDHKTLLTKVKNNSFEIYGPLGVLRLTSVRRWSLVLRVYQFLRRGSLLAFYKIWRLRKLVS